MQCKIRRVDALAMDIARTSVTKVTTVLDAPQQSGNVRTIGMIGKCGAPCIMNKWERCTAVQFRFRQWSEGNDGPSHGHPSIPDNRNEIDTAGGERQEIACNPYDRRNGFER